MNRKRAVFAGGGVVAVILVGSSMLAWANGAFGTPAVDRVGSFRAIQAQLALETTHAPSSTTTHPSSTLAPGTSRPGEVVETTRPTIASPNEWNVVTTQEPKDAPVAGVTVEPSEAKGGATTSVEPATTTTGAHVTSSSRPRPRPDDEVEPPEDRASDD